MMQPPLSKKQAETYNFIRSYWSSHGESPTYREIAQALGISSAGVVHQRISQLQRKGFVATSERGLKRHLMLIDGRDKCPCCGQNLSTEASQ